MTHSHADLKAIQTKLRSLKQDRRILQPTHLEVSDAPPTTMATPAPMPNLTTEREQGAITPGSTLYGEAEVEDAMGRTALRFPQANPADTEKMIWNLQQRSRSSPSAWPELTSSLTTGASTRTTPPPHDSRQVHQQQQQRQRIQAAIHQVNRLAQEQERSLLDLYTLLRDLPYSSDPLATDPDWVALKAEVVTTVPLIEREQTGLWVLTNNPVDLQRDQHEAESTAQFLRAQTAARHPARLGWERLRPLLAWGRRQAWPLPPRGRSRSMRITAMGESPSWMDVAIWVIGAALLRFGWHTVVMSWAIPLPLATGLGLGLIAAILYSNHRLSPVGWVFFYRLGLIAIGLVLGGQLV